MSENREKKYDEDSSDKTKYQVQNEIGSDNDEDYDSQDSSVLETDEVVHRLSLQPVEVGFDSNPETYDDQNAKENHRTSHIDALVTVQTSPQIHHRSLNGNHSIHAINESDEGKILNGSLNKNHLEPRQNNSVTIINPSMGEVQAVPVIDYQGNITDDQNLLTLIERFNKEQLAGVVSAIVKNRNNNLDMETTESLFEEINSFVERSTTENESREDQSSGTGNSAATVELPTDGSLQSLEDKVNYETVAYQVPVANGSENKYAIADPVEKVSFVLFGRHIERKKAFIAMVILFAIVSGAVIFAIVFLTNKKTVIIEKDVISSDSPEIFRNKTVITNLLRSRFSEEDLKDPKSSQSKALHWIVNETNILPSDERINELVHLASFYFAFGGDDYWQICSRKKSCEGYEGKLSWLSEENNYDYCKWPGIDECDQNGNALIISLPFNELADIRGTIPNDIHHLSELRYIDLTAESRSSVYGTIPSEIGLLQNLGKFN